MGMLDLADCAQGIWQIINNENSITAQRDDQGRNSIQETLRYWNLDKPNSTQQQQQQQQQLPRTAFPGSARALNEPESDNQP